ncbi:uncharacterized protein LOC120077673 isoform X2 [Benincasa hispida]|uniref:uncharacterized protein LOC120077673 isoform X2 n=1 Tax=Benincasa hispida TaxID=102211 RepID=UPI001901BFA4|nr:uncharacterized protein LOC120077673 isoform X2 [Benincasa hispida]
MEVSRKERKEIMELESLKKFLFKNAMKGRWKEVVKRYATDVRAREVKITKRGDTVLHVAVCDGQVGVVEELTTIISAEEKKGGEENNSKKLVAMANDRSATALHLAATLGNVKMCYDIANVDHSLVGIRNNDGETPLFLAALHGNKDAFLCLHSFCAHTTDHCRRSKDGQTILHCAIMGDFFELALYIIKLYKELVNSVNVQGFTPLHLLATKPSAFKSGTHLGRWKMIVYHCVFVDETKMDPTSFLRGFLTKPLSFRRRLLPPNYTTCAHFFNFLWKAFRLVCSVGKTEKNPNNNDEAKDTIDAENPHQKDEYDLTVKHHGLAIFPENYATCFNFLKLVSKAVLIIMGLGSRGIKKIEEKKEKHMWSYEVMNQLLKCASIYEYDDNGSTPMETTQEEETQPYNFANGNVTFDDYNISQHGVPPPPPQQQPNIISDFYDNVNHDVENKEGAATTTIIIESKSSIADKILKHFPISIGDKNKNKKVILRAATTTSNTGEKIELHHSQNMQYVRQETPVLIAAKNGVVEMVEKILHLFPVAIHDLNADQKNIVLLAVENRHPHIYELLLHKNILKESAFRMVDSQGNSALHLAAKLGDHKPWLIPGAALQMQWELKWYKFVKGSMPPNFFPTYNKEGKTSKVMFCETHCQLVKDGEAWLTSTSESCSLVAALIATVAFATSATVPGGNDQNQGTPLLHGKPAFNIFAIASLIALCCSVTSLVMFLSILTSRFQAKDFGGNLPTKLLLGLSSLFVSIAAMLVSFCAGHYFVLSDKLQYAALPVYAVTCLPVTLFAIAQFPLYVDLVWATIKTVPTRSYSAISPI